MAELDPSLIAEIDSIRSPYILYTVVLDETEKGLLPIDLKKSRPAGLEADACQTVIFNRDTKKYILLEPAQYCEDIRDCPTFEWSKFEDPLYVRDIVPPSSTIYDQDNEQPF